MSLSTLKDVYVDQLQDIYSVNKQSTDVTERLAEAATNEKLRDALQQGIEDIRNGMDKVAEIVRGHNAHPDGEHCKGIEGLVKEAEALALEEELGDDDARDAMIINRYQRMAHYAIAGYGCVAAFAGRLDLDDEKSTLKDCLDACCDGDRHMTELATSGINEAAA